MHPRSLTPDGGFRGIGFPRFVCPFGLTNRWIHEKDARERKGATTVREGFFLFLQKIYMLRARDLCAIHFGERSGHAKLLTFPVMSDDKKEN